MWRLACLLLLALASPAWAEPFATCQVPEDARITACDYEDLSTGDTARLPVEVDTARGMAPGYRVCKREIGTLWLPGSVHNARCRSVDMATGEVSAWVAATLDRPASATATLALVGSAATPPPPPPPPPDPTIMATDAFTNTTGTALTAHNALWLVPTGGTGMRIFANTAAAPTSGGPNTVNYWNATFADAHYSKTVIASGQDNIAGSAIRIQSGSNQFYYARYVGFLSKVYAGQMVGGSADDWDSGQTFAEGDEIELAVDASVSTTIHLKRNGTIVATYTGKNALSGGRPGVSAYVDTNTTGVTSWEGGDVGGGGTTSRVPTSPAARLLATLIPNF